MNHRNKVAFSPDYKCFACISTENKVLVWETATNKFLDCKFDSSVDICSSLNWIPPQHKYNSSKKAKLCQNYPVESNLLAVGTIKGDILIYNVTSKNLFLHLVGRHSDAINDMCYYKKNNSFFTCSNDQYIAIWDISSGKQLLKWKADDSPVYSICVIDEKSMLSSSTSILWWDISEKTVLKKFIGHSSETFKLLAVNSYSLNSCYFMSSAVNDTKISAWSLSSFICEAPVASFVLPFVPADMDLSKASSKDKPLVLSAVTNDGYLHLFEHTLNGNVSQPIHPKVSVEINSKCTDFSIISVKLTHDSDSCIIAYGSSKSTVTFKRMKIRELLKKCEVENTITDNTAKLSTVGDIGKAGENLSLNGLKRLSTSEKSSELTCHETVNSVITNYKKKLKSSNISLSKDISNPINEKENETDSLKDIDDNVHLTDPKKVVDALLEAVQAQNTTVIEAIFKNSDPEYITSLVNNLPKSSLKNVLDELNHRLLQGYSPALYRWLKEIVHVHLRHLTQSEDAIETLNQTRKHIDSMKISETLHKMFVLQGLLNLHSNENSSSDENDSDNEESMKL